MNEIYLIEDHHEALTIWRKKQVRNLDLVHIDAHMDFNFQERPIDKIIREANSLEEFKKKIEKSLLFLRYEKDFDRQTDIGNFIYPAILEGIVRDFFWVIPGNMYDFKASSKKIRHIIENCSGRIDILKDGIISGSLSERKFTICILEKIPVFKRSVLLDIDVDFLVTDNISNADNKRNIGCRKPWIMPENLAKALKKKIKNPKIITIAYSVNGGFTPIKYKYFGDEIAHHFKPKEFGKRFEINKKAGEYFNAFIETGEKACYRKAARLNPSYRTPYNNYGPLYLVIRKFSKAKKEFLKILSVDPKNPGCLCGLGTINLENKYFQEAKRCFSYVREAKNNPLFDKIKVSALLGLAKAEFFLGNLARTKRLLVQYQKIVPLNPYSYYLLGRIFQREGNYLCAVRLYGDAIKLGGVDIVIFYYYIRASLRLPKKDINFSYAVKMYKKYYRDFINLNSKNRISSQVIKKMAYINSVIKKDIL